MKKPITTAIVTLATSAFFAGYDSTTTTVCDNGTYKVKINRRGSLFGKNHIVLKESDAFFSRLVDEDYEQDWSPEGQYKVETVAKAEFPLSSKDFYTLLISHNLVVVESFTGGSTAKDAGEKDTVLLQFKNSNQVIRFDSDSQCDESTGF